MATPSDISVGLVHELAITACKVGWEPKDFATLAHSEDKLRELLPFVRGCGEITVIRHLIDCDADPFTPNGWKVEEHRKGGELTWDQTKVNLYLSSNQIGDRVIKGDKLRRELASEPVLNANVLDYLFAHPDLIPEEWKVDAEGRTRYIFFWGTIYRDSGGGLCVRCLYWYGGRWLWFCDWLAHGWYVDGPAALLAS
ncbi:MAG: hypothetical protein AAB482_01085 [Patescibacteria group bacterium]